LSDKITKWTIAIIYKKNTHVLWSCQNKNFKEFFMINFIKENFERFVGVLFVLTIIASAIFGGVIGDGVSSSDEAPIIGAFIGLVVGFIASIIIFGMMATLLQICDNTEILIAKIGKLSASQGSSVSNKSSIPSSMSAPVVNSTDFKVCKRCGTKNPSTASSCKDCGDSL